MRKEKGLWKGDVSPSRLCPSYPFVEHFGNDTFGEAGEYHIIAIALARSNETSMVRLAESQIDGAVTCSEYMAHEKKGNIGGRMCYIL